MNTILKIIIIIHFEKIHSRHRQNKELLLELVVLEDEFIE